MSPVHLTILCIRSHFLFAKGQLRGNERGVYKEMLHTSDSRRATAGTGGEAGRGAGAFLPPPPRGVPAAAALPVPPAVAGDPGCAANSASSCSRIFGLSPAGRCFLTGAPTKLCTCNHRMISAELGR
jgi:hypothetical protein